MKLIIQVPCFNESAILPTTLAALPRGVEGFDCVELLVVDDGSTDNTSAIACSLGVKHIIRINRNSGLANAFLTGIAAAITRGADVIVNTDGDNQYDGAGIHDLVAPILQGKADIVIGARPLKSNPNFSRTKRILQVMGTRTIGVLSGADVKDATSGFRAFTADAALRLQVFSTFTYTLETIIHAALSGLRIVSVPVRVNAPTRPSRLFRSNLAYVFRSLLTIITVFLIYKPVVCLLGLSACCVIPGITLAVRYALLMASGEGPGHVHSVVASAALLTCGIYFAMMGLIAYLQTINRRLLEELRYASRLTLLQKARTNKDRLLTDHILCVEEQEAHV